MNLRKFEIIKKTAKNTYKESLAPTRCARFEAAFTGLIKRDAIYWVVLDEAGAGGAHGVEFW